MSRKSHNPDIVYQRHQEEQQTYYGSQYISNKQRKTKYNQLALPQQGDYITGQDSPTTTRQWTGQSVKKAPNRQQPQSNTKNIQNKGPIVLRIIRLTSLLVVKMLTILVSRISYLHIFLLKTVSSFRKYKSYSHSLAKILSVYAVFNDQSFNWA